MVGHTQYKIFRKKPKLKRVLGLLEATFMGVGIILGAGIYALIGKAAGVAGNSVWMSFAIASLVAALTGLSYAELSSMFPKDAGEYIYTKKAFGSRIAFLVGYFVIAAGIISAAAVALGFGGYLSALLNMNFIIPMAIGCIIVFSLINFWGIKQTAWINILCTILEAGGLILIIILALKFIGRVNYFEMPHGYTGVFSAASLIFFAFIGFESIIKLSEETKKPTKTIPKALILSVIITTILYILVAIAAVSILGWEALGASNAPLADVAAAAMGSNAFLMLAIIALFSTANTVLIILVVTSRIMYGMGAERSLPKVLSQVHKKRKTPWVAITAVSLMAIAFALIGDITFVAETTNFAIFVTFAFINAALIGLRYTDAKQKRPFKVPLNIGKFPVLALLGIIASIFMLINLDKIVLLGGIGLTLVGIAMYEGYARLHTR